MSPVSKCHIVAYTSLNNACIAFTDDNKPAVFHNAEDAELFAAKRSDQYGQRHYVIDVVMQ